MNLPLRQVMMIVSLAFLPTTLFAQARDSELVPPEPKLPAQTPKSSPLPRAQVGDDESDASKLKNPSGVVQASANLPRSKVDLVIENPESNGGIVHFLFESKQFSLKPGEKRLFTLEKVQPIVRFHRGGDYGNANYQLFGNHYRFVVNGDGWELDRISPPLGRALNP